MAPSQAHPLAGADLVLARGGTLLRPTEPGDVLPLFARIHRQSDVLRWLCWAGPEDLAHLAARYVPPLFGESGAVFGAMLAVVDEAAHEAIGELSLTFDVDPGACEIGYWLGADAQGVGHGKRVVELAAELCLGRLGCRVVTARVKEGNGRSLRALEHAGFVRDRAPGAGRSPETDRIAWVCTLTQRAWARRLP